MSVHSRECAHAQATIQWMEVLMKWMIHGMGDHHHHMAKSRNMQVLRSGLLHNEFWMQLTACSSMSVEGQPAYPLYISNTVDSHDSELTKWQIAQKADYEDS